MSSPVSSPAPAEPNPLAALQAEFGGKRVLLVEDSDVFATVLGALLEEATLAVDHAKNGQVALEHLEREAYAAVLMDVEMPVMDGLEATRRLRTMPIHQRLPVIAMTASTRDEDRRRCNVAGMNAFVTKPANPDDLYRVLLHLLRAMG